MEVKTFCSSSIKSPLSEIFAVALPPDGFSIERVSSGFSNCEVRRFEIKLALSDLRRFRFVKVASKIFYNKKLNDYETVIDIPV